MLTVKTNGAVPNMVGLSATTIVGNGSVTTGAGDDLIAVVGADVSGRVTISAGAGDNTVLVTDNFTEVIDSSLQTFVTNNQVFGDGQDDELVDPCVAQLADDLNAAASTTTAGSVTAQNVDIYTLGGNDLIDVHDAIVSGGNLIVSAGAGTNVVAVTDTTVGTATNSSSAGNATITTGAGDDLVILDGLTVSGKLSVNTGAGSDVVVATPDVGGVVDAAITDFVNNHPGVFFDPTDESSGGLDIEDLRTEIRDLSDPSSFDVTKVDIVTKDTASDASVVDIALANVALDMTVTMGNGTDVPDAQRDQGGP